MANQLKVKNYRELHSSDNLYTIKSLEEGDLKDYLPLFKAGINPDYVEKTPDKEIFDFMIDALNIGMKKNPKFIFKKGSEIMGAVSYWKPPLLKNIDSIEFRKPYYGMELMYTDQSNPKDRSDILILFLDFLKKFEGRKGSLHVLQLPSQASYGITFLETGFVSLSKEKVHTKRSKSLEKLGFIDHYTIADIFIRNIEDK